MKLVLAAEFLESDKAIKLMDNGPAIIRLKDGTFLPMNPVIISGQDREELAKLANEYLNKKIGIEYAAL